MAKLVLFVTLISLLCSDVLIQCSKLTTTCKGTFKPCGDNKCCCSNNTARCDNFGKHLNYIPKFTNGINKLYFANNSLPYLSAWTFKNLTNESFSEIHLVKNKIESITEDAFKGLKSICVLEISGNSELNMSLLWNSFRSLEPVAQLTVMLTGMGIQTLDDDPFRYLRNSTFSVHKINLSNNKITHLNITAFKGLNRMTDLDNSMNHITEVSQPVILKSLSKWNLHGNKISGHLNFVCSNDRLEYFPNLHFLVLSSNVISKVTVNSLICLKKVRDLYLNENDIKSVPNNVVSRLPKLETLHIEMQRDLKYIYPHGFNSSSLKKLFVNKNNIKFDELIKQKISIDIFQNCPNLEVLDISKINFRGLSDIQILDMFSYLSKLKSLYANSIRLTNIPKSFISTFPNLTNINLDNNFIKSLKGLFNNVLSIQTVSIANNKIQVIEKGAFPDELMKTLKVLHLANNPFDCSCEMLWFRDWIHTHINKPNNLTDYINSSMPKNALFVNNLERKSFKIQNWPNGYVCNSPPNMKDIRFSEYHPTIESCKTQDPMIIVYSVIGSFLAVFSILSMIVYKKQWYIKYIFYKMKIKTRRKDSEMQPLLDPNELRFDGYVIYDDEDNEFVHNDLIRTVEDKLGYKLHIWHRNAESGAKLEVTVDAIYNSDNVIAIVSKRFMKNSWCQFAMDVAMDRQMDAQREHLFLIILEDVDLTSLSKYWCVILTRTPTAYWCDDESDIKRSVFEQKCIKELGTPLLNRVLVTCLQQKRHMHQEDASQALSCLMTDEGQRQVARAYDVSKRVIQLGVSYLDTMDLLLRDPEVVH